MLAALFYCYAAVQRVVPSVIVSELMRDFAVGAGVVGYMAASYMYPYALLQVPMGVALDRWGLRRTLTTAAALCGIGSLLFALAESLPTAYLGRALIGTGAGVGLLGCLRLAAVWLPARRLALASGLALAFAMLGSVLGQAPFSVLADALGWRTAQATAATVALALAAALAVSFRFLERHAHGAREQPASAAVEVGVRQQVKTVVKDGSTWLVSVYGMAMALPLFSFAMLWGVPYLVTRYGVSSGTAALGTMTMLLGWGLGSPLMGALADRIGSARLPMLMGSGLALAGLSVALYLPGLSLTAVGALFFMAGLGGGAMVLTFTVAGYFHPPRYAGTVYGLVNMLVVGAGAVGQPLIGLLLDLVWDGTVVDGVPVYSADAYALALLVLPAAAAVALVVACFLSQPASSRWIDERV